MEHYRKIAKAMKLAPKLPQANEEIWKRIPKELIERVSAQDLALIVDALDCHWHYACRWALADAVAEGCIWSDKHNKLLEINIEP